VPLLGRLERRTWEHDPTLKAPSRYRRACSYDAFIPYPIEELEVSLSGSIGATLSDAEAAIRDLNAASQSALAPMARLLLRTESIASSKVEGMQVDTRALAKAEVSKDTGQRASQTALDVLANVDAMELAIESATSEETFAVQQIVEIHRALLEGATNSHIAGKIRRVQNWIGGNDYNPCGADFVPPPPEEVDSLLSDLCRFCEQDRLAPLAQAAIAHAQFETIHPFEDGNGRTGRALVQVILRRRGLAPSFVPPISVVLATNRKQYIAALTAYREGRIDAWLEVFGIATARAASLARQYLGEVESLQENWRSQVRESMRIRSDAAVWALIDVLPSQPVITLPLAVARIERTKPAANMAITQLASAGVLVPISESKRNRAWEAAGLLDLISRLEAGEVPEGEPDPDPIPDVSLLLETTQVDEQITQPISSLSFTDPIYRLAPGSWLISPGEEPELTLRVAVALPNVLPIGGSGSTQLVTQLRGQRREELLSSVLEASSVTSWLRSLGPIWHWDEREKPVWTPAGSGSPEFTELWFAPFGFEDRRPWFMARCAFVTGVVDDGDVSSVPTIEAAIDLMFNIQELGPDRQPDNISHAADTSPIPAAFSLGELAEDLIHLFGFVPVVSRAADGLLTTKATTARVGAWVSFSGAPADRLIDLRAFRRIPRSVGMNQALGALQIRPTTEFELSSAIVRPFVAELLYEALERGGYRDVDQAIDAIREGMA
jgi:Fic family protein